MAEPNVKTRRAADYGLPYYFDMQAKMGHTKHLGGLDATRRLAELCQVGPGQAVLNVGSGSGIPALYLAEHYGCRVVGVDILEGMVESARAWAARKGMGSQVDFRVGDARQLPFEDGYFDVVVSESVLNFVPQRGAAIAEYVRVVKAGGYVGTNEAIWVQPPPPRSDEVLYTVTGQRFLDSAAWEALFREAGLAELTAEIHGMTMGGEARAQFGLLGIRDYLGVMGKAIRQLLQDREFRALMKYATPDVREYFAYMGYGLYVGRKAG